MLSNTEEKPQLSRQLSNLGTLYENLGEIYGDLSDKDLFNFSELLSDQVISWEIQFPGAGINADI